MRKLMGRLVRLALLFAAGTAFGYYLRDRGADSELERAVTEAREAGQEALDRARRAAADVAAGARAAAESTQAGVRELVGDPDR